MSSRTTIEVANPEGLLPGTRYVDFDGARSYRIIAVRDHELDVVPWRWHHSAAVFPRWLWYRLLWGANSARPRRAGTPPPASRN